MEYKKGRQPPVAAARQKNRILSLRFLKAGPDLQLQMINVFSYANV